VPGARERPNACEDLCHQFNWIGGEVCWRLKSDKGQSYRNLGRPPASHLYVGKHALRLASDVVKVHTNPHRNVPMKGRGWSYSLAAVDPLFMWTATDLSSTEYRRVNHLEAQGQIDTHMIETKRTPIRKLTRFCLDFFLFILDSMA
jgi:hypothetical protein